MKNRRDRIEIPPVDELTGLLSIDLQTGEIRYKPRPMSAFTTRRLWRSWNSRFAGKVAGHKTKLGYWMVTLNYERILAHRIIWKVWTNGDEPEELDHIDRNPLNNSVSNLRPCTRSENNRNRRMSEYNTTGFTGVYERKNDSTNPWIAQIKIDGKSHHLGKFETKGEAVAARHGAESMVRLYAGKAAQRARARTVQKRRE